MKDKVLNYLKRTGLFLVAQPLSHWVGVIISGILSITAAFIFKENYPAISLVVESIFLCIAPLISLFFFVRLLSSYCETDRFSPKTTLTSLTPLFVAQWIYLFIWGPAFWINGICAQLSFMWLPDHKELWPDIVVQLGLQLLVYLPIYLLGSYCGYRRRVKKEQNSD